jgi:hypothetical protein
MKKILSLILITLIIIGFMPSAHGETGPELTYKVSNWNAYLRSGRYYIISDPIQIETDNFDILLDNGIFLTEYADAFIRQYVTNSYGWTSKLYVYDTLADAQSELPFTSINLLQEGGTGYFYTDYDFSTSKYKYITINLLLDHSFNSPGDATDIAFYMNTYDYAYDYWITGSNNISIENTVADLPLTNGSIYENVDDVGDVDFNYDDVTGSFYAYIHYYGTYLLDIPLVDLPYDDFFENVESANYYSYDGEKFIIFYYDINPLFKYDEGNEPPSFKGWSIWNLTTNEVVTVHKMFILTYIDIFNTTEAYAYMYIPDVPVDDLLSVSLTYKYRNERTLLNPKYYTDGTYTDWSIESQVLEKDVQADPTIEQWVYDSWTLSAAAIVNGTILSIIPGTQPIGIPLLLSGGVMLNVANAGAIVNLTVKEMTELERINYPSQDFKDKIDFHFSTLEGTSITIGNDPLYRLYLGNTSGFGLGQVEYEEETFKYTEVVYMTDGQVYTLDEQYIETDVVTDFEDTANLQEDIDRPSMNMMYLGILTLAMVFIAFKVKAFDSIKHVIVMVVVWLAIAIGFGLL